jgi:hypothetical protein
MTDVSSARSIDPRDHLIDSGFAIRSVIKSRFRKRTGVDVEAVYEVEHGPRRGIEIGG